MWILADLDKNLREEIACFIGKENNTPRPLDFDIPADKKTLVNHRLVGSMGRGNNDP